jgi:hypothetical protein
MKQGHILAYDAILSYFHLEEVGVRKGRMFRIDGRARTREEEESEDNRTEGNAMGRNEG